MVLSLMTLLVRLECPLGVYEDARAGRAWTSRDSTPNRMVSAWERRPSQLQTKQPQTTSETREPYTEGDNKT
jgi:hypothetical protein